MSNNDMNYNIWNVLMPECLSIVDCYGQDPIGDGSCLMSALPMCTFHSNTNFDCFILQSQIIFSYLDHPYLYFSCFIPLTNLHGPMAALKTQANQLLNLKTHYFYTKMMNDPTLGRCAYESLLEVFAFAENNTVYQIQNNFIYHMITSKHVHNNN